MKTTKEMIEVMRAYEDGQKIEYCPPNGVWAELARDKLFPPIWNWDEVDYRIKEEPKTKTLYYWEDAVGNVKISTTRDVYGVVSDWTLIDIQELTPKQEGE